MVRTLTLATIHTLDGGTVQAEFDRLVAQALEDCHERPGLETAREVGLKFTICPVQSNGKGTGNSVEIACQVTSKIPAMSSNPTRVELRRVRGAKGQNLFQGVFNDAAPDDPAQRTLDELSRDMDEQGGKG